MSEYSKFYKKFNDHVNDYPGKLNILICKRAAMYMSKHYKKQLISILESNELLDKYSEMVKLVNAHSGESLSGYSRNENTLTVEIGTKTITYTKDPQTLINEYFPWKTDSPIMKGFFNLDFNLDLIFLHSFFYNNLEKEPETSI